MEIDDWEFSQVREKDGGPIVNWLADVAMKLSSWLARVAHPYAKVWSVTIPEDFEEDSVDIEWRQFNDE